MAGVCRYVQRNVVLPLMTQERLLYTYDGVSVRRHGIRQQKRKIKSR